MIRLDHERRIMDLLPQCSDDEVKVVHRFLQRIHNARREYGPLRIKRDTRDFRHEAAAEAFDGMFYLCLEDVRRGVEQEPRFEPRLRYVCSVCSGPFAPGTNHQACQSGVSAAADRVRQHLTQREG